MSQNDASQVVAQPTPGPFSFDPETREIAADTTGVVAWVAEADDFPCLADDLLDETDAELNATGVLLAAAWDLLAFAKWAMEPSGRFSRDRLTHAEHTITEVAQRAAAAVAKAEGRQL